MSKEKQQSITLCRKDFLEVKKAPPSQGCGFLFKTLLKMNYFFF